MSFSRDQSTYGMTDTAVCPIYTKLVFNAIGKRLSGRLQIDKYLAWPRLKGTKLVIDAAV